MAPTTKRTYYSKPDSKEIIERSKALRKESAMTSKKLAKVLREGEKFLHEHDTNEETSPNKPNNP